MRKHFTTHQVRCYFNDHNHCSKPLDAVLDEGIAGLYNVLKPMNADTGGSLNSFDPFIMAIRNASTIEEARAICYRELDDRMKAMRVSAIPRIYPAMNLDLSRPEVISIIAEKVNNTLCDDKKRPDVRCCASRRLYDEISRYPAYKPAGSVLK